MSGLGFHGNLDAEPGSEPWALAWREEIRSSWSLSMLDALMFRIQRMADAEGWRALRNKKGQPFASLTEFLTEKPMEGIGMDIGRVQEIVAALRSPGEVVRTTRAGKSTGRPKKGEANTPLQKGTSAARLAARIKRDAPEIAERVERGEFKSMRQAAIVAGVLKVPTTLELAQRAFAKLSAIEKAQFMFWIHQQDKEAA